MLRKYLEQYHQQCKWYIIIVLLRLKKLIGNLKINASFALFMFAPFLVCVSLYAWARLEAKNMGNCKWIICFFTSNTPPKWEFYMAKGKPTLNIISIPKTFYNRKPHKIKDLKFCAFLCAFLEKVNVKHLNIIEFIIRCIQIILF